MLRWKWPRGGGNWWSWNGAEADNSKPRWDSVVSSVFSLAWNAAGQKASEKMLRLIGERGQANWRDHSGVRSRELARRRLKSGLQNLIEGGD